MNSNTSFLLGLKIKEYRTKAGLSFLELSKLSGLSASYLNEIEKGKKFPKPEKLKDLADALQIDAKKLISNKPTKALQPIHDLLTTSFLHDIHFDLFGINHTILTEIFSRAPKRIAAFISAFVGIVNNYSLTSENIYYTVLRKYQELNENYFIELENEAKRFRAEYLHNKMTESEVLKNILRMKYKYTIDETVLANDTTLHPLRSVYAENKNKLYINSSLNEFQLRFLLARELGFNLLKLKNRPQYTPAEDLKNFEQALYNFRASYFAIALLINESDFKKDVKSWISKNTLKQEDVVELIDKYEATPEMFMQRLTNVLPKHFGIRNLYFVRTTKYKNENFSIDKSLFLCDNKLSEIQFSSQHTCMRWLAMKSLQQYTKGKTNMPYMVYTERNQQVLDDKEYWCISIVKSLHNPTQTCTGVTIGIQLSKETKQEIVFLKDKKIKTTKIGRVCEQCTIENCKERRAPYKPIKVNETKRKMKSRLNELLS